MPLINDDVQEIDLKNIAIEPVMFMSGKFNTSQSRWHISQKELYPIIKTLLRNKYMLLGNKTVNVFTDHHALKYLIDPTKKKNANHRTRLLRWVVLVQQYRTRAFFVKGKDNRMADILSRRGYEEEHVTKIRTQKELEALTRKLKEPNEEILNGNDYNENDLVEENREVEKQWVKDNIHGVENDDEDQAQNDDVENDDDDEEFNQAGFGKDFGYGGRNRFRGFMEIGEISLSDKHDQSMELLSKVDELLFKEKVLLREMRHIRINTTVEEFVQVLKAKLIKLLNDTDTVYSDITLRTMESLMRRFKLVYPSKTYNEDQFPNINRSQQRAEQEQIFDEFLKLFIHKRKEQSLQALQNVEKDNVEDEIIINSMMAEVDEMHLRSEIRDRFIYDALENGMQVYDTEPVETETGKRKINVQSLQQKKDFVKSYDTREFENEELSYLHPYYKGKFGNLTMYKSLQWQRKDDLVNINDKKVSVNKQNKILLRGYRLTETIVGVHVMNQHTSLRRDLDGLKNFHFIEKQFFEIKKATQIYRSLCLTCNRYPHSFRMPFGKTITAKGTREVLMMDYLSVNDTGKILVLIDNFSRKTMLHVVENATAENAVKALLAWDANFVLKENFILRSDQGSHFCNKLVTKFLKKVRGKSSLTVAFSPWTNGSCEVENRIILKSIRTLTFELREILENIKKIKSYKFINRFHQRYLFRINR